MMDIYNIQQEEKKEDSNTIKYNINNIDWIIIKIIILNDYYYLNIKDFN